MPEQVPLSRVRIDGDTQQREAIDEERVNEYAENVLDLPPYELVFDGLDYWLWDGFHRYHGAVKAGLKEFPANVTTGTKRDAVLLSLGANATHGKSRTHAEKRSVVKTILADPEWQQWADREIARYCKVSHPFVAEIRKEQVVTLPPATRKHTQNGEEVERKMETLPPIEENVDTTPAFVEHLPPSQKPQSHTPPTEAIPQKPAILHTDELAAALADGPADSDPEMPWVHYNGRIDSIVDLLYDLQKKVAELPKGGGQDAAFATWFVPKEWEKYFGNAVAVFKNHRVANWASTAQTVKAEGGRNFLYVHEVEKKPRKKNAKA